MRIHLDAAQELIDTSGVHRLVFSLERTDATDEVAAVLGERLDDREFEIRTWYELTDFYARTVALYRRQFGVMNLFILIMVMLSVANSINMAINERRGEFGTLMALGQRGCAIFWQVLLENTLLGIIGAAAVIASILPAYRVSRLPVVDALRENV